MGLKESGLRGSLRNVSTGVVAIPDSAILEIDATQDDLDDQDSVPEVPDFSGEGNDLSGSGATYLTDVQNGQPAYDFETGDIYDNPGVGVISQPFTIVATVQQDDTNDWNHIFSSTQEDGDTRAHHSQEFDANQWRTRVGEDELSGGDNETDWIVSTLVVNGSDSALRVNGSDIVTGTLGGGWEGFQIGDSYFGGAVDMRAGILLFADDDLSDTGELGGEEQRQADIYGISLD